MTTTRPGATPATPPRRTPLRDRLLEVVGAGLRREPSRDLAHRRQQRQPAAVGLDHLVGDRRDAGVDERARQRLVGRDVQVREEREALAQPRVLGGDRLLHLEQELRARPDVVDRDDRRAGPLVRLVPERAARAGAGLDEDVVPSLDELPRARRCERDPVLLRLDLAGDADPHGARDDSDCVPNQGDWPDGAARQPCHTGRG